MTRIAKGKQKGELWDRVILSDGMVGYVFQNYLKEYIETPQIQVQEIKLSLNKTTINKNERVKLNIEILPEEAKDEELEFSSSNGTVALVDNTGTILGVSSGTATITAKAANNVSSSINITVYSPVTDIQLNAQNAILQVGDMYKLNPIIYPEDASNKNVKFSSSDEDIAKIDETGNITAIKEGKTTITAKTEDGNKTSSIEITVIKKLNDTDVIIDESLKINGTEVSGFDYKKNTVKNIKDKIHTNFNIEIYNNKGEKLSDENRVGSGSTIRIVDDSNNKILELIVILYGDVNGDGKINSVDLLVLQRHILEIQKLEGVFLKSGNINKNGKKPSSIDSLLIQRHILEIKIIEQ